MDTIKVSDLFVTGNHPGSGDGYHGSIGLPEAWMDSPHGDLENASESGRAFLSQALRLLRENRAAAMAALEIVERSVGDPSSGKTSPKG